MTLKIEGKKIGTNFIPYLSVHLRHSRAIYYLIVNILFIYLKCMPEVLYTFLFRHLICNIF